jgi:drug/metabolite transporter (DMT)-like permease
LALLSLGGRFGELRGVPWREAFIAGGLGLGGAGLFLVWGQAHSDAVTAAIITTGLPLFAALMGAIAGDGRPSLALTAGVFVAVSGGVVATLGAAEAGPGFRGGEIMVLVAVLLFVWYSRRAVRKLGDTPDLPKSVATLACGAGLLIPASALVFATGLAKPRWEVSWESVLLVVWMGPIAFAGASLLWLKGSRLLGVTVAGIHQNEVPFFVMAMMLLFGGNLLWSQVVGAFLVLGGAVIAQSTHLRSGSVRRQRMRQKP